MCDEEALKEQAKFVMFPQEDHYNSLFEAFVSMCNKDLGPIDPDWYTRGTALQLARCNRTKSSLPLSASGSPLQQTSSQSSSQSTPRHGNNDEANISDTLCQTAFWTPCTEKNECKGDIFKTPALPENDLRQSLGANESGPSVVWTPSLETPPHIRFGGKTGHKQIAPKMLFGDKRKNSEDHPHDSANEDNLEGLCFGSGMETEVLSFCNKAEAIVLGRKIDFEIDDGKTECQRCFSANALCAEAQLRDVDGKGQVVVNDLDQAKCSGEAAKAATIEEGKEKDNLSLGNRVLPEPHEDSINTPPAKLSSAVVTTNMQSECGDKSPHHDGNIATDAIGAVESPLGSTQLDGDVAIENDEEKMDISFAKSQNDFLRGGYSLTQILEAAESTAACMDAPDFAFTQTEGSGGTSSEDLLADWDEQPVAAHAVTDKGERICGFAASSPLVSARSFSTPCSVSRISKRKPTNLALCVSDFGVVSPINGTLHKERPQGNRVSAMGEKVFTGFTTGTGNIVSVAAKSLNAARRLLCTVESNAAEGFKAKDERLPNSRKATNGTDGKMYDRNNGGAPTAQRENFVPTGFSTAGGKSIQVSATALTSAKQLLSDEDPSDTKSCPQNVSKRAKRSSEHVMNNACSKFDGDGQRLKTAFTTGSGKAVSVSKTSLSSAREIFSVDVMASPDVHLLPARNSNLSEQAEAGKSAQSFANSTFTSPICNPPADEARCETRENRTRSEENRDTCKRDGNSEVETSMDFNSSHTVGEDPLQTAKCDEVDAKEDARNNEKFRNVKTFFTTGSGRAVSVSADALKNAGSLLQDEVMDVTLSDKVVTGFTTGSGRQVHVTKGSLKTAETLLSESKCLALPDENCNTLQTLPECKRQLNDEKVVTGFSTGNGKVVTVSKSALASAQNHLNSTANAEDDKNKCHFGNVQKCRKDSFAKVRDLNLTDGTGSCIEKTTDENAHQEERIRESSALDCNREQTRCSTSFVADTSEQKRTPQIQRMFTSKMGPQVAVRSSVTPFKAVLKTTAPARGTPQRSVPSRTSLPAASSTKKNPVQPGKLWILRKLQKLPRVSMRHVCGNPRSHAYSLKELEKFGVTQQTASITSENAGDHRFRLPSSDELVILGDGIILSPHSELQLGREELYRKFVKMPGVELGLICEKWFANHYRWVVWKLAAMERRFPQVFGGRALTADQVMLQMKYRYDTEIDNSSRPALRKIVEQDDIPSKTMVLCVSCIKREENMASLEVTDGWYSVKAELDEPLSKMVADGHIFCGQKLITSCAELVGSTSACSPLEIPDDTALKMNFNTTRRARWDAKLGYFRSPQPFPVPLASLHPKGGPAGRVDCVVVRTYPLLYLEKRPNGTSIMRNERTEHLVAAEHERVRAEHAERLMAEALSQVEKADDESIRLRGVKSVRAAFSVQQIQSLSSGKDIWKALQCCADASEIESLLSEDQVRTLREYQEQCYNRKQAAAEEKFQQALRAAEDEGRCPKERTVIPVLKVLLGGLHEKDLQKSVCCIASVWRPFPELQEMLTEGKAVSFYNVGVCPVRNVLPDVCNSAVELTTLKHTKLETVECPDHVRIYYERQVTSFSLLQSQLHCLQSRATDVVGVVFLIHRKKEVDAVFLTDPWYNFVQVTVHGGCDAFTAESRVDVGQVIAATDLLVKRKQQEYKNTVALAMTELSEISPSPRRPHLRDALAALQEQTPDVNLLVSSALQQFSAAQRMQLTYPAVSAVRKVGSTPISRVYATRNAPFNTSSEAVYRPGVVTACLREMNTSTTEAANAVAKPAPAACSTQSSAGRSSPSLASVYDGLVLSNSSSIKPGSPAEARSKQIRARIALLERYGALAPLPLLSTPESDYTKRPYRTPVRKKLAESLPMDLDKH